MKLKAVRLCGDRGHVSGSLDTRVQSELVKFGVKYTLQKKKFC